MKIRIEHDGSMKSFNTKITNAETGELIERVSSVAVHFDVNEKVYAILDVEAPELDIVVDTSVKLKCPDCGMSTLMERWDEKK